MHADPDTTTGLRLFAAVFTPLRADHELDLDVIAAQHDRLKTDGVAGAFVAGTTGEGAALTTAERQRLAEAWMTNRGDLQVLVHVGHTVLAEARTLAAHAAALGADGIAAVAPYYHRPPSVADLVDFCAEVAAAAPETPFFYYHAPSITGVHLPAVDFLTQARARIPTLAGIKYTDEDLGGLARCLQLADDSMTLLFGRDELLLPALALGASAAVGSTYNFAAPLFRQIADALAAGELETARRVQGIMRDTIEIATAFGGHSALKAVAALLGVDCGPCRRPLPTLDAGQRAALREQLDRIGFFAALTDAR